MNVSFRFHGGLLLLLTTVTVNAGCSVWSRGNSIEEVPVPLTNRTVAETVIRRAFENLEIPDGNGIGVCWYLDASSLADELAAVIVPEYLFRKGFRITEANGSIPEIRFTVDTLFVALRYERSKQTGKRIARSAVARINATVTGIDGAHKVYMGTGIFQDFFPAAMMDAVGKNESYVTSGDRILTRAKPVVFCAVLTFFLWYLYSFRG